MTNQEAIEILEEVKTLDDSMFAYNRAYNDAMNMAIGALKGQVPITGETSDGYHTFNELYNHRAVLFSVIVANYKDRAWKSVRHHDGTMYDGMFIVGIDTPDGQATYHYDINPYWDMFDCKVREFAPEWDGHTPEQAIERIGKLKARAPRVMTLKEVLENAQKIGFPCWVEDHIDEGIGPILFPAVVTSDDTYIQYTGNDYYEGAIYHWAYNKRLRCWTSRPTDEQREAEVWNN